MNVFISYHHALDQHYKDELSKTFKKHFKGEVRNNSLKEDISQLGDTAIKKTIRYRFWQSSVIIILIGKETYRRDWILHEINISQKEVATVGNNPRRKHKPKGILVIELPEYGKVPKMLQEVISNGYAVTTTWEDIHNAPDLLREKLQEAYDNRGQPKFERSGVVNYFKKMINSISHYLKT